MTEQLAYSPRGLADAAQVSLRLIHKEMQSGRLHFRKIGRRTIITAEDAKAWLLSQRVEA